VNVTNADNGGSGTSNGAAALFGFSNLLGSDDIFSAGEKTTARTIQFRDQAAELFSFDAVVTAYQRKGTPSSTNTGGASGGSASSESSGTDLTNLVRITVNPLTKIVTVQLLQ
jgi:hypothetical protein